CTHEPLPLHYALSLHDALPIWLGLLQTERDAPIDRIDVEDLDLDLLPRLEHLRGMGHALGPRHLGDVDEPLEPALDLDERPVVGDRKSARLNSSHRTSSYAVFC